MDATRTRQISVRDLLVMVAIAAILILIVRGPSHPGERARQAACVNNLKQIAVGLQSYQSIYGTLPPAYVADGSGRRLHSWRVLLKNSVGDAPIVSYKFDEPWDGPGNAKLVATESAVSYSCPSRRNTGSARPGRWSKTSYLAVTGPGTLFPTEGCGSLANLSEEELAETILVVESVNQQILWTEPRDFDLAAFLKNPVDPGLPRPSSFHPTGINVATADGRVATLSLEELHRRLIEMARRGQRLKSTIRAESSP